MKPPAVPNPAREDAAFEEDSLLSPAISRPSVEPEQLLVPVRPSEVIVPYADFLEHRRRRHGAASELAPPAVEASEE
jgi:hypothetical protein